jgi:pyrimidine operon attenuation protein/uracil phosphoribosyltransferase
VHPDYAGVCYTANPGEDVLVKLKEVDGKDEVVVMRQE